MDRLIKDKNYNEAILELSVYMKENPEDFDGAQRRIKRIINMRELYNNKGIELVRVLSEEPTNDKKKLDMIAYMESMEKNPNQATRDFIVGTKSAAQFTYYRAKFDEIMISGAELIDKGLYVEAARKFTEGYFFYKQDFDDETASDVLSEVNTSLGTVMTSIGSFSDIQVSLTESQSAADAAIRSLDIVQSEASFTVYEAELIRLSRLRNLVAASGWSFEDLFAAMQKRDPEITENSFLPFAQRFTLGRKTATHYEGVLGAIDAQWNNSLDVLEKSTDVAVRSLWLQSFTAFNSGDIDTGVTVLQTARRFAILGGNFASTASHFEIRPDSFGTRAYLASAKKYTSLASLVSKLATLGTQVTLFSDLDTRIDSFSEQPVLPVHIRKAPSVTVSTYSRFISELDQLIGNEAVKLGAYEKNDALSVFNTEFEVYRQEFYTNLEKKQLGLYRKQALFQNNSVSLIVSEWKGLYGEANNLLDGVIPVGSTLPLYYPAESIVSFNNIRSGIVSDRKAILDAVTALKKAPQSIQTDTEYSRSIIQMENALTSLVSLYTEAASGITRANSRILQANLARQESDLRYSQSQAALKKYDFQSARDNLQRSRDKVNQSLGLQESAALRAESDLKLEKLGLEITRIENESVVREVRSLISSGKNLYYLGNFDQAEQIFLQAKTRWSVTNIEPNSEVKNWLEIINTALSMKTGRTIPVSAPLYPQMSQILSSATQLYTEGKSLIAAGKRTEALSLLATAKAKIQQLQLVYPINQDAGLLTLRIDQLIDPPAFEVFFKQKVDYIRVNYRIEKQTSYSDLLDLAQLNPSYPGIKRLVDEVEIYLGIQIPPPDPKALARSSELTRSAQKIYDANTRSQFQVAVEQLSEAIKLNPDNKTAIALIDRLQTSGDVGGQRVAVLSGIDEAKYQQAVQELQKGNKITASAIVEQLLLNPKSRNSSKIQDLKKRIDAQL